MATIMELLLFRPHVFEAMYNCTNFDVDRIPHEYRIHLGHGCVLLGLFVILEILYIPCMISIYSLMATNSCYKLMFFIGIIDMTFLQVVIISFVNALASMIYIYMQFVRINDALVGIIVGTYLWVFAHGSPPVNYLLLNKSIRTDCARFGRALLKRRVASAVTAVKTAWPGPNQSPPAAAQQPMQADLQLAVAEP